MSSTQAVVPSVTALRRAARPAFAPLAAHARADARRRRVSHRAPALRPHLTHKIAMRVRRTHNREGSFRRFRTPKSLGWGWPSPGFAVLPFVLVRQAKEAVANMKAAEEAAQVRSSPHWMDSVSVALRATHTIECGNIRLIRTVRCVGPPPCDSVCACVRQGEGRRRAACAFA
jgi:hypothetical protein